MTTNGMAHRSRQGNYVIVLLMVGPCLPGLVARVSAQCETTKITPADGATGDQFGTSVDVSGDTLIVGAPLQNATAGAAYIYVRQNGQWTQQAKLLDPLAVQGFFEFGRAVSVSGDFVAVGVPKTTTTVASRGVVHMFRRSGTAWTLEPLVLPTLISTTSGVGVQFGASVSVDGDAVLVGAPTSDDIDVPAGLGDSGAAYVMRRDSLDGVWKREATLLASDAAELDQFGTTVLLRGNTAFVTAFADKDPLISASNTIGSVYVFNKHGSTWVQTQKLVPSDAAAQAVLGARNFGRSLGTDGSVLLVGERSGQSAYVFGFNGSEWVEEAILKKPAGSLASDQFGNSVAISGDIALVGAPLDDDNSVSNSGTLFVYHRIGGTWTAQPLFYGSAAVVNGRLGTALASRGTYAVAGAIQTASTGAAYVLAVQPVPDCDGNLVQDECQLRNDPSADILPPIGVLDACQCQNASTCEDHISCTQNTCNVALGVCEFPVAPGFCFISGVCHADGAPNPANECQICNSAMSGTAWSNRPETPIPTPCADDGNACTQDFCVAGVCTHPPAPFNRPCGSAVNTACDKPDTCDGAGQCLSNLAPLLIPCPDTNFCNGTAEVCNGMGTCVAVNPPCSTAPNDVCDEANDRCVECVIDAHCPDDGNECANPACDPVSGICGASALPTGSPCGDPTITECDFADTCDGQGVCQPNHIPDNVLCTSDNNACNGMEVCHNGVCTPNNVNPCAGNPAAPNCVPTPGPPYFQCVVCINNAHCNDGNECTFDACVVGGCQFTSFPAGSACGSPIISACDVPDTCDGETPPVCLPNFLPDGRSCADLLFCNGAEMCTGGQCASAGDACPAQEVCNEELDRCEVITCGADQCFQAQAISGDGLYCFDNTSATTDGPNHTLCPYFPPGSEARDLWYCWQAPATGETRVETCGFANIDSTLAVYAGCACPTAATPLIRCSDDSCGLQTTVDFGVVKGQSYLIRLSSFPNTPGGAGLLSIQTDAVCGAGAGECCFSHLTPGCNDEVCCTVVCACDPYCCEEFWDPFCAGVGFQGNGCGARLLCGGLCPVCVESSFMPNCEVDAGQPHAIDAPSPLHGPVQMELTFYAECPVAGLTPDDFSVSVHPRPAPVEFQIINVSTAGLTAMLDFSQPFPAGHWTCVTHIESGEQVCNGFLPGDSDGDGRCTAVDVQGVAGSISVPPTHQWANFATDLDRSGVTNSFDIIHAVDLLNGAGAFDPWLGAQLPPCPGPGLAECATNPDGAGCSSDGNSCTQDACLSGACTHSVLPDGTACDDGDPNTTADACNMGVCAGVAVPPGMAFILAGEFMMGDSFNEGTSWELPRHPVYVDAFYMDRYEVSNQQYADALNWAYGQGGLITVTSGRVYKYNSGTSFPYCDTTTSSTNSRITWNGSTFGIVAGKENHPMVQVSWWGSAAYSNWRSGKEGRTPSYDTSTWACDFAANGYRLPTEAEWEKAARGGAAGHRFPWSDSDTIQHARANYYSSSSYFYDISPTREFHPAFSGGGYPYTSPVGYFAPNGYGLYDMAGNVWEWGNDWYSSGYYSSSPYNNPRGPTSGSYRVIRGGSWLNLASSLRCADRYPNYPYYRFYDIGFRLSLDSE